MLRQTIVQNQSLRQEQIMAPQQIQSLEILQAPVQELEQKIFQELAANPTLELLESGSERLIGNPMEESGNFDAQGDMAAEVAASDEAIATLIQLNESWQDYVASTRNNQLRHNSDDDERRQYLFDSLVTETTLQENLLEQLRQADNLEPPISVVAEEIIGSIDESGYLRSSLEDICLSCNVDVDTAETALHLVQSFEPPGIGARDLRECLLLQMQRAGSDKTLAYVLVKDFLDDIARNQIPKIARELAITPGEVYQLLEEVRRLNPYPGNLVAAPTIDYVVPEVFVEKDDNDCWQVRNNREVFPRLRLSPLYLKLLKDPETPPHVRSYIRQKIADSKLLMRALGQRETTIERITTALLHYQPEFFRHGAEYIRPLTMTHVAEDLGLHETTVSRAIANKYMHTPHGLIAFRRFFTAGLQTESGEMVSSNSIKQKLSEILQQENSRKPLSDQKLTQLLQNAGFKVARRTVAKYREELGIASSSLRRNF